MRSGGPTLLILLVLCVGCSSRGDAVRLVSKPRPEIDFSGSWELDYRASETLNERYETLALLASRRSAQRPIRTGPIMLGKGGRWWGGLRASAELGQMADELSRSTVLGVVQDEGGIVIERNDDYPLSCAYSGGQAVTVEDPLGRETCGWDDHQLLFHVALPDGLEVSHRLTLAPDGQKMNIATTLNKPGRGAPFTINRVYRRFEAVADDYECETTLTGGRSCRRVAPSP